MKKETKKPAPKKKKEISSVEELREVAKSKMKGGY